MAENRTCSIQSNLKTENKKLVGKIPFLVAAEVMKAFPIVWMRLWQRAKPYKVTNEMS